MTTETNSPVLVPATCPLCNAPLRPGNPTACEKCDWVAASEERAGSGRDVAAVLLSVVPGLGHIYKGHRLTGALYMLGAAFALIACTVAATFTAGFGLLLLPLYWAGVMLQVYWLEDRSTAPARRG